MKIAMVSTYPAFPTDAGNRSRIRGLAQTVCDMGHELHFIYLPAGKNDIVDAAAHEVAFGPGTFHRLSNGSGLRAKFYFLRKALAIRGRRLLRRSGSGLGYYTALDAGFNRHWLPQLRELGRDMDAVIVEYVFNSRALEAFPPGATRIIDTHDSLGDRHRSYLAAGLQEGFWISLRPRAELTGFRRADAILAIQQEEAASFVGRLAEIGGSAPKVAAVSHILDTGLRVDDLSRDNAALFLASATPSNVQAVENFMQQVLPLVVAQLPTFEFCLAGSICKAVPDHPNVIKLGRVDTLSEAYRRAPVAVNPMLSGTGINIKLLDAMAAGVPTVSTDFGLRGLPETFHAGMRKVPGNAPDAFARELLALVRDGALRDRLGAAAYADALKWNASQKAALTDLLRQNQHQRICSPSVA